LLSHLQIARRYISYYLASKTLNSVQSPSLNKLISETIEDNREFYAFRELEAMRADMLRREEMLDIVDLGAGSKVSNSSQKSIAEVAKSALSPPKKAQFLFRLIRHLQPNFILELGTSLGLSALYMHKACSSAKLITVEGSPHIAHVAKHYFDIEKANIQLINASFDEAIVLPIIGEETIDVIYLDGNHTYEATLRYVKTLSKSLSDVGVIILDDIYWSVGMMKAWKELRIDNSFTTSIDLFDYGLLIKDATQNTHKTLTLIPTKLKPFA